MSNLKVNVKDYKLNCNQECIKNLRPVFNVSASSYSCSTKSRRINSEPIENQPQPQQITSGQTQQQSGSQLQSGSQQQQKQQSQLSKPTESTTLQKSQQGQQQVESHHEDKTKVDITMRDGNTGEFLARGHLEFDPSKRKETKYEDNVSLRDMWGNEIGTAIVDIEQEKLSDLDSGFDEQMRHMRREMKNMMKDTNRLFGNFSKRFLGRNYGFDLLDDFRNQMIDQDWDQPWRSSLESGQQGGTQQKSTQQQSGTQQQQHGSQQKQSGSQQSQSQQSTKLNQPEDTSRRTQEKDKGFEITEEKPVA
jgi:hypothetical protein